MRLAAHAAARARRAGWRTAVLSLLLSLPLASAATDAPARVFERTLPAGANQVHTLQLRAGDFVSGALEVDHGPSPQLWLEGAATGPRRRLAEPGIPDDFMFVAAHDGPADLRVQGGDAPARYVIRIDRVLPAQAQVAPDERLRSPRLQALREQLAAGGTTTSFWEQVARNHVDRAGGRPGQR